MQARSLRVASEFLVSISTCLARSTNTEDEEELVIVMDQSRGCRWGTRDEGRKTAVKMPAVYGMNRMDRSEISSLVVKRARFFCII